MTCFQVIPTISTSPSNIQQSGVTRFVNISQPQRVVNRGSLQLANSASDGRVSIVALSSSPVTSQVRSAHPTLVTSLASPIRQSQRTNSVPSPTLVIAPSNQANYLAQNNFSRKRPKLFENLDNNFFNDEQGAAKRRILDYNSVKLNQFLTKYAECVAELFFLEADGNIIDFPTWKSKRHNTQQFHSFLQSNKLDFEDDEEDLTAALALHEHEGENKPPPSVAVPTSQNSSIVPQSQSLQQQPQGKYLFSRICAVFWKFKLIFIFININ